MSLRKVINYTMRVGFIALLVPLTESCQPSVWDAPKYQKISLDSGDSLVEFRITDLDKNADVSKTYYWYKANEIQKTKGGVAGKPLHGEYEVFTSDGQIITKGSFDDGLKTGIWLRWNENQLGSQIEFDQGIPNGNYKYYRAGKVVEEGQYLSGNKNGRVIFYDQDSSYYRNYKEGRLFIKPDSVEASNSIIDKLRKRNEE